MKENDIKDNILPEDNDIKLEIGNSLETFEDYNKNKEEKIRKIEEKQKHIDDKMIKLEEEEQKLIQNRKMLEKEEDKLREQLAELNKYNSDFVEKISKREIKEKAQLVEVIENLGINLKKRKNKNKNIYKVYENLLNNEDIKKREIKDETNTYIIYFMFYFIAPLFGIIFLIGIFQIITVLNSLFSLLKESGLAYYNCFIKNDCNITLINNTNNVFEFYEYFNNNSINETISLNLMMVTGFVGELLLKSRGFRQTSFILGLVNFGTLIWLNSFDFKLKNQVEFNYSLSQIIYILICYILLLSGIGGSALLAQQILVNSHSIYKDYVLEQLRKKWNKKINENKEMENKDSINEAEQNERSSIIGGLEGQKQKRIEDNLKNINKNKFDYFFIICLITTCGYFGKYLINYFLNKILSHYLGVDYDKKIYFFYIIILYGISVISSIILYTIFICIFREKTIGEEKKDKYRLTQVCGYIIYSQDINKEGNGRNCCYLCCESTVRCCNKLGCILCNNLFGDIDELNDPTCMFCCCCEECCEYNEDDFEKKKEFFCYCYQAQRKSFWCNQYFINDTQKKIIPFMIEYFIMQLISFGFEKQYEENKGNYIHRKTFILVLVISFILFFYFSLSMHNLFNSFRPEYDDKDLYSRDDQIMKSEHKEAIGIISNEILDGQHGVLFFNSVFSLIFSSIYLSKNEKLKQFFFENNLNYIFIPVLMNKFYYLTLNYYCTYTCEEKKLKEFEIISASTLISIYMVIWRTIIFFIQWLIPDNKTKIFYIIHIILSSIPSLIVGGFIIFILISTLPYIHRSLFCILSFILCFGGVWNDMGLINCCCCDNTSICYCDCCFEACGEWTLDDGYD